MNCGYWLAPNIFAALFCVAPAKAHPSLPAQEAVLQYYRHQASFLQIYSRALDRQNGLAAAQAIEMLTDEFIQWGQRVVADINDTDFRTAMCSPVVEQARNQCDESIAIIQQQSNELSRKGTNYIMLDSRFTVACAHFTCVMRQFNEAMGL